MRYRVLHRTAYDYSSVVTHCHNEAYLMPRDCPGQQSLTGRLRIDPAPAQLLERRDYFGNRVSYFAIETPHTLLTVRTECEVMIADPPGLDSAPAWDRVRDSWPEQLTPAGLMARGLTLPSPFVEPDPAVLAYARPSFPSGRPLLEAVMELTERIHADFIYDPHSTDIVTPLSEVLEHRRGVCQDFAHLGIACLRSLGLAARYVSGYLETLPPPGRPKLQGVDASHAWFAVHVPEQGWYDFDPTNRQMRTRQYITTAWGRDYGDVTPLKGVVFGGGEHQLAVAVDVQRLD